MAGFRYGLQSILDIKDKMETQARQEFALAKDRLEREERAFQKLVRRREDYEARGAALRRGALNLNEIRENRSALLLLEERIREQRSRMERARDVAERSRERLEELIKERKMHESLKERAFEAYLQEENRMESKSIDELTSYIYGQKRQGN